MRLNYSHDHVVLMEHTTFLRALGKKKREADKIQMFYASGFIIYENYQLMQCVKIMNSSEKNV